MKMLKIINVLKFSLLAVSMTALTSQAFAEDIELTGTYGNYLKPGCSWFLASSNNYGPSFVPPGATANGVQVDVNYLVCNGNSAPNAVKVIQTNYTYVSPNSNNRTITSQSCTFSKGVAQVSGDCLNHRVYN